MRIEKLNYDLPLELIAQEPVPVRSDSRLLVLNRSTGEILDSKFNRLGDFLLPGDCLVLNDTKVIPARFFAQRPTGAKLEGLFLSEDSEGIWTVYLKGSRRLKSGGSLYLKDKQKADFCQAVLIEKLDNGTCRLKLVTEAPSEVVLEKIGFPPLPPYITRDDHLAHAEADSARYQTVYARRPGAVAAPTAGLHFTEPLIEQLKQAGISFAFITLHVGAGTFKPISSQNVEDHQIHEEQFSIDEQNARTINEAKSKGGRIIPVGTTSTRALETVAGQKPCLPCAGTTELFIKPGYEFKITDALITNFHLPRSSLLTLVAAFGGLDEILAAYRHAIERRYRFYSYGDAMLIL